MSFHINPGLTYQSRCLYEWDYTLHFHGPDGLHMQVCVEGRGPWILASPMHRHPLSDCLRAGHGHQRLDHHCGPYGRDEGHMLRYGERSHHDCQQHQVSDVGGRRGIRFCLSSANLSENTCWPLNPLFSLTGETTSPPLNLMPSSSFSLCCNRSAIR